MGASRRLEGEIAWLGMVTPDLEPVRELYGAVFGWDITEQASSDGGAFGIATRDGVPVISAQQAASGLDFPSVWNPYFAIDDLERSVATAEAAGATLMAEPFRLPDPRGRDLGHFAFLLDPTGAGYCLWQIPPKLTASRGEGHGFLAWTVLHAEDSSAAARFYERSLGWTMSEPGPQHEYLEASVDGVPVAGIRSISDDRLPGWRSYFNVDDLAQAIAAAIAHGGSVVEPPSYASPDKVFAMLADANGAQFGAVQRL